MKKITQTNNLWVIARVVKWVIALFLATSAIGLLSELTFIIAIRFGFFVALSQIILAGILNILTFYFLVFMAVKDLKQQITLKPTNIGFLILIFSWIIEGAAVYLVYNQFPNFSGKLVSLIAGWYGAKKAEKVKHVSLETIIIDLKRTFERSDETK